ncbi:MAG: class I SAM-dependent methyltransferase [Ignavibacteria bacterium]|nr:class I SAM-dependent methyltransferase [Ignavibacteria bacterium]
MEKPELILLPGLNRQIRFLIQKLNGKNLPNVLVIGSFSELVAKKIETKFGSNVEIIVEDYDSLINSKYIIRNSCKINVKMMSYDSTDYPDSYFDLVYAQASISLTKRNKIIKEIKRILKPGSYFCVGEVVSLDKNVPRFVLDIYDNSDLMPLFIDDLEKYYTERKFNLIANENLSSTLKDYFTVSMEEYKNIADKLGEGEKSYYKKVINKIKHESNAYLKLGADKFIGYSALLMTKEID